MGEVVFLAVHVQLQLLEGVRRRAAILSLAGLLPGLEQHLHALLVELPAVLGQPAQTLMDEGHEGEQERVARQPAHARRPPHGTAQGRFQLLPLPGVVRPLHLVPASHEVVDLGIAQGAEAVVAEALGREASVAHVAVDAGGHPHGAGRVLGPQGFHRACRICPRLAAANLVQTVEQEDSFAHAQGLFEEGRVRLGQLEVRSRPLGEVLQHAEQRVLAAAADEVAQGDEERQQFPRLGAWKFGFAGMKQCHIGQQGGLSRAWIAQQYRGLSGPHQLCQRPRWRLASFVPFWFQFQGHEHIPEADLRPGVLFSKGFRWQPQGP